MSGRKRGLGRGLDALLTASRTAGTDGDREPATDNTADGVLTELPVEWIQRGKYQPRRDMDPEALQELADSIKAQGIMQPIVVRPVGEQRYEIIAGERRWRAAQLAGLEKVPVLVRDVGDDAAIAMALIENIQREDLNPMDEAIALHRLQDEFGLTQHQVAMAVGKSRSTVTNLLRLMQLEPEVKKLLEHGDLDMGHARSLLALTGESQREVARAVVARGLSVRQTEALVRQRQTKPSGEKAAPVQDPDIRRLEQDLSEKVGASVRIDHRGSGKGKLVVTYGSLDELEGILAHFR